MTLIHGFELVRGESISELNSEAKLYRHVKTGAELLSLSNDDENKSFGISFRTVPSDSTGVPHILEHAVLCGSRKYPLKEPFVELLKGSLKTFLNAFTSSDQTVYPLASQNTQDFYNLIDVYLDAVFHPLIPPDVLKQEGWHYELESVTAPLKFKGVVFNEMKGAYASPDNVLFRYSRQSLSPDNTYGVDSGGDPAEIPNLTYEQFKSFHETYYHPSNSRIFFYGDDDSEKRLEIVDGYLREFDNRSVSTTIPPQDPFTQPRHLRHTYATELGSNGNAKSYLTLNWLLPPNTDPKQTLSLSLIAYLLTGTPASPLRKTVLDAGICENLIGGNVSTGTRQMRYTVGMKGVAGEDLNLAEQLILDTMADIADEGFDPATIEAALNTVEFRLRENNTGSFPRGLAVFMRALSTWLHDGDPWAALRYEAPLQAVKERIAADPDYLTDQLRTHWLDNNHRTTVILQPDPNLAAQQAEAEEARLAEARSEMDEATLETIVAETNALRLHQETPDPPEKLALLPMLRREDLEPEIKTIPREIWQPAGSPLLYHDLFTNGIAYLDIAFDLHALPLDLLPYVKLFGRALLELGTEKEDFIKLTQRIGRKTGGISTGITLSAKRHDPGTAAYFRLSGKATADQAPDMLDILRDMLLTTQLDNQERFRQLVLKAKAGMESSLIPAGHTIVNQRLRAPFAESSWLAEHTGGVSYLFFLRQLAEQVENDWPSVLEKLETIQRLLIQRDGFVANLTLESDKATALQPALAEFVAGLPAGSSTHQPWDYTATTDHEAFTIPAQVNYVGQGGDLYQLGYELHGSIEVITGYLRTTWLWDKVRVQGGAYGVFVSFNSRTGTFALTSYRDPNLQGTLDNFAGAAGFLQRLDLNDGELTKCIIGAIGRFDRYQLPDAKGYSDFLRYLVGISDAERQQRRTEVLSTTVADFQRFGDVLATLNDQARIVVLGSAQAINQANINWSQVQQLL